MNEAINYTSNSYETEVLSNLIEPMYLFMHRKLNLSRNVVVEFINDKFKRMLVEKMWHEIVIIGDSKIITYNPETPGIIKKIITRKTDLFNVIQYFSIHKKTTTAYILRIIGVGSHGLDLKMLIQNDALKITRTYMFTAPFSILKVTDQFIQDDE